MMDIPAFRTSFPEFADSAIYPSSKISFWAGLAEKLVLLSVWGDCRSQGVSLYVAHELVLEGANARAAAVGGAPGQFTGAASSKSVGSVSVGYDSSGTSEKDAGYWNLTTYGKQFIRLARMFGAGAIQL